MIWVVHVVSGLLLFAGCLFVLAGAVGMIRMPDVYTRIHAASLTDTGGATFVILGLMLQGIFVYEEPMAVIKLGLILIFTVFTAPTASHAIAKAALMGKLVPEGQNGLSAIDESLIEPELAFCSIESEEHKESETIKGIDTTLNHPSEEKV